TPQLNPARIDNRAIRSTGIQLVRRLAADPLSLHSSFFLVVTLMKRSQNLIRTLSATIATLALAAGTALPVQAKTLNMAWSGGTAAEAEQNTFIAAFEEATGAKVELKASELALLAQLESMVKIGKTTWDLVELSGGKLPLAVEKDLLEPLDYSVIDPDNQLP